MMRLKISHAILIGALCAMVLTPIARAQQGGETISDSLFDTSVPATDQSFLNDSAPPTLMDNSTNLNATDPTLYSDTAPAENVSYTNAASDTSVPAALSLPAFNETPSTSNSTSTPAKTPGFEPELVIGALVVLAIVTRRRA
ncbi:MAG: hypothetical protein ACYDDF_08090 [Thermoplasmatota archaeon]